LEAQGLLARERGPAGKIINRLVGSSQTPGRSRAVDAAPSKTPCEIDSPFPGVLL
jgi:hypothetical protein